jgi:Rod binding domain-containing protein
MDPIKLTAEPIKLDSTKQTQSLKESPKKDETKAVEAAEQFETMLALQFVQSMQKPLENGSLFGSSNAGQMYGSLSEWELARIVAKSAHFGLKEQVLQQVTKQVVANDPFAK